MAWATSNRASRLPKDWERRKASVKRRDHGRCQATVHNPKCDGKGTEVDHDTMFATIFEYDQRLAATYIQSLHKGTPVRVEGDLKWQTGTDRNGQPHTDFIIDYATIGMVLKKAKTQQSTPQQPTPQQQAANWGQPQQPDPYAQSYNDEW